MEKKEISLNELLSKVDTIMRDAADRDEAMQHICALLHREVPHYDWVGIYLVDPLSDRQLVLGPYVGEPTEHTRIAFGQGICGQAAETLETFVINDVSLESNYLSCSPSVQSEIVVPIMKGDELIGEIDVDSHKKNVMTNNDRKLLETVAERLARFF